MIKKRTFGWVQNPSSFDNLKSVVQLFIKDSEQYNYLINILENKSIIKESQLCEEFLNVLKSDSINPTYKQLVGTGFKPRSKAPCNGIAQACIKAQKTEKLYVDNWTADGFIRWAECLGFINYKERTDSFEVTTLGQNFALSIKSYSENEYLKEGLLSYPPTYRVLCILSTDPDKVFSKFEIGSQLGFSGENGFTSFPFSIIKSEVSTAIDNQFLKKINSDIEGSSDKYARMICSWLINMGWVRKEKNLIRNQPLDKNINITHSFKITLQGRGVINEIIGGSRHKKIKQRVSWFMLATNAKNRDFLRNRRYEVLRSLCLNGRAKRKSEQIIEDLKNNDIQIVESVLMKDINGLNGCGISINNEVHNGCSYFKLESLIELQSKPSCGYDFHALDEKLELLKQNILSKIKNIDSEWVELIEISRLGKVKSQIFEYKINEIMNLYYGLNSRHLGGASKPDCIAFNNDLGIGLIIDAKAYENGFTFSSSEKDKMVRYVTENSKRDFKLNSTKWWEEFSKNINMFKFLFVSSYFSNNAKIHLENISNRTKIIGGAISAEQLILGADYIQNDTTKLMKFFDNISNSCIN